MKKKMSAAETYGRGLAQRLASRSPMTKRAILKQWPAFDSLGNIDQAIDWIEANTATSDNPLLFVWDKGEAVWGFRSSWVEVEVNLFWNIRYLRTRVGTFQKVLEHAIDSPVVSMTMGEARMAKGMAAQMGGVAAYLDSVVTALEQATANTP